MTFEPLENLNGKVVVITGVMGGIGLATAKRLAFRGARIFGIVRRNLEEAEQAFKELHNQELDHKVILADVNEKEQLVSALKIVEEAGRCDILVITHGKTRRVPHHELRLLTDDFFDQMLQNNLRSYFSVIRTFEPLLKRTEESLVVNIGSLAGQNTGGGSNLAYITAKAGIDALTRNLAKAMAPIRVMGVSPGILNTGFVPNQDPHLYELTIKNTPLKRLPSVDDVASAVDACATLLRFANGQVIGIDGGRKL